MPVDPPGHEPTLTPTQADPVEESPRRGNVAYRLGDLLGKGGMGEVWAAADARLGREVALKRMRTHAPSQEELERFLREAKIQARLPHPSIVPVYELGTDDEGFPYFTMKRLAGTTLAQLLASGKATQQRMLRALVDVCLAIHLAHENKIVHRDLKPSNIMLGDYGEVYVIDWGVARIVDEDETPSMKVSLISSSEQTKTGQLLGTPGYMSPEQVRGLLVAPASDVYSLGSILFEILAGEPLHPRGTAALASTLDKHDGSPARRAPARAIPPELDELCREALSEAADARPTARELGERIQQYLDGDRDLEQRRALAAALVVQGRAALDLGERADAVRLAGRALALDPNNEVAAGLVMSLLTTPPAQPPPEVEKLVAAQDERAMRDRSRRALMPMLGFYLLTPFLLLLTVLDWRPLAAMYAGITLLATVAFINWRVRRVPTWLWIVANIGACIVFTRASGPFVLTPVLICSVLMSAAAQPWLNDRRWALIILAAIVVVTPFVLEELGVFAKSWMLTHNGIVSHGTIFLRGEGNAWPLFIANLAIVVLVSLYSLAISRDRRIAQRALIIQTWQPQQLLPKHASTLR
jgi:serine/threonine-protein kinase